MRVHQRSLVFVKNCTDFTMGVSGMKRTFRPAFPAAYTFRPPFPSPEGLFSGHALCTCSFRHRMRVEKGGQRSTPHPNHPRLALPRQRVQPAVAQPCLNSTIPIIPLGPAARAYRAHLAVWAAWTTDPEAMDPRRWKTGKRKMRRRTRWKVCGGSCQPFGGNAVVETAISLEVGIVLRPGRWENATSRQSGSSRGY